MEPSPGRLRLIAMKLSLVVSAVTALVLGTAWAAPAEAATSVTKAWATPNLAAGFTPQGMTQWGKYIVMAEYKPGANTRLVAVDLKGKIYGQVSISENHAGGIAIVGKWLFVQDQPHVAAEAVRSYRLTDFSAAMAKSHKAKNHPTYVGRVGLQQLDTWQYASFMTADGAQLLSGHYAVGDGRMYRYDVNQKTGHLTAVDYVPVPDRVQGLAMDGKIPVYTSYLLLQDGTRNFLIPAHAEGVVVINRVAYVSFEGGATHVLKVNL
jgi:hypothetical protein